MVVARLAARAASVLQADTITSTRLCTSSAAERREDTDPRNLAPLPSDRARGRERAQGREADERSPIAHP
jgi:hypothetical protein